MSLGRVLIIPLFRSSDTDADINADIETETTPAEEEVKGEPVKLVKNDTCCICLEMQQDLYCCGCESGKICDACTPLLKKSECPICRKLLLFPDEIQKKIDKNIKGEKKEQQETAEADALEYIFSLITEQT